MIDHENGIASAADRPGRLSHRRRLWQRLENSYWLAYERITFSWPFLTIASRLDRNMIRVPAAELAELASRVAILESDRKITELAERVRALQEQRDALTADDPVAAPQEVPAGTACGCCRGTEGVVAIADFVACAACHGIWRDLLAENFAAANVLLRNHLLRIVDTGTEPLPRRAVAMHVLDMIVAQIEPPPPTTARLH